MPGPAGRVGVAVSVGSKVGSRGVAVGEGVGVAVGGLVGSTRGRVAGASVATIVSCVAVSELSGVGVVESALVVASLSDGVVWAMVVDADSVSMVMEAGVVMTTCCGRR